MAKYLLALVVICFTCSTVWSDGKAPVRPVLPVVPPIVNCATLGKFQCGNAGLIGTPALGGSPICIPFAFVCNGRIDCANGADETNCPSTPAATTYVTTTSTVAETTTKFPIFVIQSSRSTTVNGSLTYTYTTASGQPGMTTIQSNNVVCTASTVLAAPMSFTAEVYVFSVTSLTSSTVISASVSCVPTVITPTHIEPSVIETSTAIVTTTVAG